MDTDAILLELAGIDKRFGGVHALDSVSFDVQAGEVHAVVGENGAGKSTLMKILAGSCRPDAGVIRMSGKVVSFNTPRDSYSAGINTMYQEFYKFPALTVVGNIFAGREVSTKGLLLDERTMRKRSLEVFDRMGVEIDLDAAVKNLSVAEQQLIEIAKALVYEGRLVIMDEPNSSLTERETRSLFAIIRRLKEHGIAVLYVSHRLEEVFQISDRITVLRDGKYIGTWNTADVQVPFVITQMIGHVLSHATPKGAGNGRSEDVILEVKELSTKGGLISVSLSVKAGEVVGLAGLEGCGIRDLFHVLFGLERAQSGEVYYLGKRVRITTPGDAIRLGWGMIPANRRDHALLTSWSVKENITVVILGRLLNFLGLIDDRKTTATANEFVGRLGIATDSIEKKVLDLSGGNQQKVVLAKWLATSPKFLMMDDPTRGIDVAAKAEVYSLVRALADEGIAILLSSSEVDEVLDLSDRILIMRQGAIIKEFDRRGVRKADVMLYTSGDPAIRDRD